jgi:hypothetical protein
MLTFYITSYIIIIVRCFNSSSQNVFIRNIRKYRTQILYHPAYEEHRNLMIVNSIYYNYLFAKTFSIKETYQCDTYLTK